MMVNENNVRIGSFILLIIGLFLPMISVSFFGMSEGISLFHIVTNIQSLSFLGDGSNLIVQVYTIFLVYLISIVTCVLAIFKNSKSLTIYSGIAALIYSGIVFLRVSAVKSDLISSSGDPFSSVIGSAAASMFNVDIGVAASFLASLLLFGTLFIKK